MLTSINQKWVFLAHNTGTYFQCADSRGFFRSLSTFQYKSQNDGDISKHQSNMLHYFLESSLNSVTNLNLIPWSVYFDRLSLWLSEMGHKDTWIQMAMIPKSF